MLTKIILLLVCYFIAIALARDANSGLNVMIEEDFDVAVDISGTGQASIVKTPDAGSQDNSWADLSMPAEIKHEENKIIEKRSNGRELVFSLPPGYKLPSAKLTGPRPPGSLLLNMLTKNERDHLDRTLPQWAKIIDCWVIGIDDHNTDDSVEIIQKHLGHIPGNIVVVSFDGMGPTWTELVKEGYTKYPQCTHGIIADADFKPRHGYLDKMQLDVRCSKHMYSIFTEDLGNERKMDWIYRNIPGVFVSRRTHQILESPVLPDQEVFQTLIDLQIVEQTGGYQDRTPGKMDRYIGFLKKDLEEIPNDPRSLYYLGYAYYELYMENWQNPSPQQLADLNTSIEYFVRRVSVKGNKEEGWFAMLKLGEIYERFKKDVDTAAHWYKRCIEDDPDRADGYFYLGQLYRLTGRPFEALEPLRKGSSLVKPERSLFQFHALYTCITKVEFARVVSMLPNADDVLIQEAANLLRRANCQGESEESDKHTLLQGFHQRLHNSNKPVAQDERATVSVGDALVNQRIAPLRQIIKLFQRHDDTLFAALGNSVTVSQEMMNKLPLKENGQPDNSQYNVVQAHLDSLRGYIETFTAKYNTDKADPPSDGRTANYISYLEKCRTFRGATTQFLRFLNQHSSLILSSMGGHDAVHMRSIIDALKLTCRN